jgi:hypothetical protein
MTSHAPEAVPGPSLAGLSPIETLLLEHISSLESELAAYRPAPPPPGWLRVKTVADKLGLSDQSVYKMAKLGRIVSDKIGPCLWIAPIEVRPPRKKYKSRF